MSIKVIGSGFGRTGTKSLKDALELLGFAPCHHMYEIVSHPEQIDAWEAMASGKLGDLRAMYSGYQAQVDWPGANCWREALSVFPDAKVVHSLRPADSWWRSFERTIAKLMTVYPQLDLPPHLVRILDMNVQLIGQGTFGGKFTDRDTAIAAFNQRTEEVRATVPPERLLIFDVAEGWEPLCAFLDCPVPDQPFPHHNLRADFWDVVGGEPA